ncbi:MAG: DUF4062 domain-containing protein [Actinobacteria bacterium]|nr:DUF4062 domain-containing protein [Actinomycetota bacterium]
MNDESLIIDRAAAAARLSREQVRDWAADKRVFISSVMDGLEDERRAVAEAIRELGAEPIWFEEFGARDQDPEQAYLSEVELSDVYVGILGSRYGSQDAATGYSATHAEYLRAIERGLRVGVWVLDVDDMAGHQRDFLSEVRTYFTTETVDSPERLATRVAARLDAIASEDVAPWCKIGNVILRASSIRDDGTTITVEANVRDRDVAHALQRLRPDGVGAARPVQVVFGDTVGAARPTSVENEVTAGSSTRVVVTLTRDGGQRGPGVLGEVSFNTGTSTYSPDDLAEIGIRRALFDEPNPLGQMGFLAHVPEPLGPLRHTGVTEENLRPILRLALVEALVGSGRASRIVRLLVGPRTRDGQRRLLLEWEGPTRYGQRGQRRQVEGTISV